MRFEFLRRIKEDCVAAQAGIDPRLERAAHPGDERALRAGLAGYMHHLEMISPAESRSGMDLLFEIPASRGMMFFACGQPTIGRRSR